jgi:hypothetical protein
MSQDEVAAPTVAEIKASLDELHYQAENMSEPWMLDAERQMRWLLVQYLRPTLDNSG